MAAAVSEKTNRDVPVESKQIHKSEAKETTLVKKILNSMSCKIKNVFSKAYNFTIITNKFTIAFAALTLAISAIVFTNVSTGIVFLGALTLIKVFTKTRANRKPAETSSANSTKADTKPVNLPNSAHNDASTPFDVISDSENSSVPTEVQREVVLSTVTSSSNSAATSDSENSSVPAEVQEKVVQEIVTTTIATTPKRPEDPSNSDENSPVLAEDTSKPFQSFSPPASTWIGLFSPPPNRDIPPIPSSDIPSTPDTPGTSSDQPSASPSLISRGLLNFNRYFSGVAEQEQAEEEE